MTTYYVLRTEYLNTVVNYFETLLVILEYFVLSTGSAEVKCYTLSKFVNFCFVVTFSYNWLFISREQDYLSHV